MNERNHPHGGFAIPEFEIDPYSMVPGRSIGQGGDPWDCMLNLFQGRGAGTDQCSIIPETLPRNLGSSAQVSRLRYSHPVHRDEDPPDHRRRNRTVVQNLRTYGFALSFFPSKMYEAYGRWFPGSSARRGSISSQSSRDYGNFEEKFRARKPAFLLPNPWQTLEARKVGYSVFAMAGEPRDFKGIFLVRRDSGIRNPADLKGRAVSYPSRTALAACIMPLLPAPAA
jgi:hypothetical protein